MIGAITAGLYGTGVPPVTNSYESIATVTVGSGGSSSISFTSIPSTYKHLQLRGISRNTTSGAGIQIGLVRFNGDSGTNYTRHALIGNGSSAVAQGVTGLTGIWSFVQPQIGELANTFGATVLDILDYTNTSKNSTIRSLDAWDLNGTSGAGQEMALRSGVWLNTSAITQIDIVPTQNGFAQYSQIALYGIKG